MDYLTGVSLFLGGVGLGATGLVWFAHWLRHRHDAENRQLEFVLRRKTS